MDCILKTSFLFLLFFSFHLSSMQPQEPWFTHFTILKNDALNNDTQSFDAHVQEILSEQNHLPENSFETTITRLIFDALEYFPLKGTNVIINTRYTPQTIRIIFSNLEVKTFLINNPFHKASSGEEVYFFEMLTSNYVIPKPDLQFFIHEGYENYKNKLLKVVV